MNEILTNLSKVLPQLAILAAVFGFIGWSLRGLSSKPAAAKPTKPSPSPEKPQGSDRAKNLETALEKSRSAHKALKADFDELKTHSVSREEFDTVYFERDAASKSLETEIRRASTLEAELKKAQETNKKLNARANEENKANKDRGFTLENELSKAREQLAVLQNRPDNSAELQAEIERLRESVATSTRFAGELRKREATAIEALEKAEARLASALETGRDVPAPSKKIGPIGDSSRIAAAKAEVIRLVEQNKKKAAEADEIAPAEIETVQETPAPELPSEEPIPAAEQPATLAEEPTLEPEEPAPSPAETASEPAEPAADPDENQPTTEKKQPAPGDLFALD